MSSALIDLFVDSFWQILLPGLTVTVPLTILAFSGALVIAVIVALVQFARVPVLKDLARFYIWVTRGTPLLVQLFVVFYGLPHAGFLIDPFVAAVVVFAVNEGAYCAETIRAALESVPTGQLEAGLCSGLSYLQVMRHIVLPQAFRTVLPPLGSVIIAMLKNTSIASAFNNRELISAMRGAIELRGDIVIPLLLATALVYLLLAVVIGRVFDVLERKLVILR